jgi:hypothetical protein
MLLRQIDPTSAARTLGLFYAFVGLLIGALLASFAVAGYFLGPFDSLGIAVYRILQGFGAAIMMPILCGFGGFLLGLIGAKLYNRVARRAGGIQLDLE